MAIVAAFQVPGLKLWFWSNDHAPPHFHAKRPGQWEVKVHFLADPNKMIELCWETRKPTRRDMKALTELAEEHRLALLDQWHQIRTSEQ